VWPYDNLYSIHGGVLFMTHGGLDTLYIENVEISHNILHDPDDYDAVSFQDLEFVLGNFGRALYLDVFDSFAVIMRDCVFHDNREPNPAPETDYWWSLGSTVHIFSNSWGPGTTETHVKNCSFTDNDNGGLRTQWDGYTIIENSIFRNNKRYGIRIAGENAEIYNTYITGTMSEYYALFQYPSRQCAITILTTADSPHILRNITIAGNACRNLLTTNIADHPASVLQNCLIYGNSYQSLTAYWNDPQYDQPAVFEYCILPEFPDAGENNLIGVDPLFDEDLGAPWLSTASPAIDAGDGALAYNDLEDPAFPGFALWPSQGGLRNDIGYTGGPFAGTLDHLVEVKPPAGERPALPGTLVLAPAFPNPFNPRTTLVLELPEDLKVRVSLFNIRGQMVKELHNEVMTAGSHSIHVNGSQLASGVYFVQATSQSGSKNRKILLLK
ncbi:MAG: T9SS type A sorting domain-containing protein, partial [Taibaiella sp.]|nr:T9SS type A sorting domain-containing protein [Taibaiella sp.]